MSTGAAVVLAHGGGAPEALMVGLPVLLLAVFGVLELRARRAEAAGEEAGAPDAGDGSAPGER